MTDWPGVFVSSTCYDLIDLRAELEVWIRDLGLIPIMSDRPTSEFDTSGYRDSITTCIENVRKCPTFVCILSNRYGPRLGKFGFDNLSATHLEYRAAVAEKRRILFYVRDRLLGDLQVWKNARKENVDVPTLPWVDVDQYGIFELLTEHMHLSPGDDPNWVWPFRDSAELKQRLALDLALASRRAKLTKLIESDRIPNFALASSASGEAGRNRRYANVDVHNMGPVTAMDVEIGFESEAIRHVANAIAPGNHASQRLEFELKPADQSWSRLVLKYSTPHGHRIEEKHSFESRDSGSYVISRSGRSLRLLDAQAFVIE